MVVVQSILASGAVINATYGHLSVVGLQIGNRVEMGGTVGLLGQTGNAFGQPRSEAHVHLQLTVDGVLTDPANFLNQPCNGQ